MLRCSLRLLVAQYEREEAGALAKVLDRYQLHSLYPLAAVQSYLPSALKVLPSSASAGIVASHLHHALVLVS